MTMILFNPANTITLCRFFVGLVTLYFQFTGEKMMALILFIVFVVLDGLDGFVARRYQCETTFGKNFDFFTDGIIGFCLLGLVWWQGVVPTLYVYLSLVPLVLLVVAVAVGVNQTLSTFVPSHWRKWNGAAFFSTIFLFLVNTPWSIACTYLILVYFYVARVKHLFELYQNGL